MKLFTLPNLLTLANLFCGCLAVLALLSFTNYFGMLSYLESSGSAEYFGNNSKAYLTILLTLLSLSLLFDLLDGMIARAMKINSEIGVQLDSLADVITFGLVPGLMMLTMLTFINYPASESIVKITPLVPFLGLTITLFSALRLAKFNVDTEQTTYFKGLATPANTILIFSLFWIQNQNGFIISSQWDVWFLIGITILSCWLLISNIPLFSFKFKGFAWKDNHFKYVFIIISIILLIFFQMNAVPFIILLYIILSIIFKNKIINA